ncbi:hypothetical protein IMZ48_36185 [Candidatus Bathyarchaeota archaeon]|nr:hypothetical protein [Candidatus Bathyarchaeota archaeon]
MMLYNVTNAKNIITRRPGFSYLDSEVGRTFPLNATTRDQYVALSLSSGFGSYLGSERYPSSTYPNPFNISFDALANISLNCAGIECDDKASISSVYVGCGRLRGGLVRVDGGPPSVFDNGSKWSSALHACAATVRTSIKTVGFAYNASSNARGLIGLSVTRIVPKHYASDKDHPLWGFEESGHTFNFLNPIWGLISEEYESQKNVSSVRHTAFYIPGIQGNVAETLPPSQHLGDNLPGSNFTARAVNQVFEINKDWP